MGFEALLIEALQKMSNSFTDTLFLIITMFGEELFFMLVTVILYWCIDKRYAFRFFNVYIFSAAANEGLKSIIKRPRPFDGYESIRSIGDKTSGYSFPSGHSQSIANITTQISRKFKKRWMIITLSILTLLVMLSRMYLGQHYLTDVIVGAGLGVGIAFLADFLLGLLGEHEERILFVIIPLCLLFLIVLCFTGFNGMENVLKVLGGYTAFGIGYYFEKKFVKYDVRSNKLYKHFVKVGIGLLIALVLKEGLKYLFPADLLILSAYLRYFIVAAWASIGCPALFKALKL